MAQNEGNAPAGHPRVIAYPTTFDDGGVENWFRHFNKCARANRWNDEMKLRAVPVYFRSRAQLIYDRLRANQTDTWEHLEAAMTEAFAPDTPERRRLARRFLFSRGEGLEMGSVGTD